MLPPGEKIVKTKTCRISGEEFFVTDKDLEFYDKVSPVLAGKKMNFPTPTTSPYERMIQKFAWRNERNIYRRKCGLTGKDIISMYHPDSPYQVYGTEAWWSDDWSCFDSARSPDWDKPFFDQFHELMKVAPLLSISALRLENSEYNNAAGNLKNCYMCFDVDYLENCYYLGNSTHCNNSLDGEIMFQCDHCYECFNCSGCNAVFFSTDCENCNDLSFCFGCTGCHDCLFCFNQYRKEYCINNIQYSPEEYKKRKQEILGKQTYAEMFAYFQKKRPEYPVKYMHGTNNESCTGDYLSHSRNTYNSFEWHHLEDCKNTFYIFNAKNCQDHLIYWENSSFIYQSLATGLNVNSCAFCAMCWDNSQNIYYSLNVISSQDCFGCAGIKKGKYCLFNKPYSVQEYETLTTKMIEHMKTTGEWWEFFPMKYSPYGYNETVGMDYTPLSPSEVTERWWQFIEREPLTGESGYTPKHISEYDEKVVGFELAQKNIDEILSAMIICTESRRPFRLQKRELGFLIENSLPIPTVHPQVRHANRIKEYRAGTILYERKCSSTGVDIITPYAPERPEKVLSEEAYRREIY